MSGHIRILRRAYTGNLSLKTTDHCRTTSLLPSFSPSRTRVSPNARKLENGLFLCGLENALSSLECAEIIQNGDKCLFENMSDKYQFGKQRNSSRLLVLDEALARNLWNNIEPVLSKEMENLEISKQPLGFAVTKGEWELHGLNEAMRISKYSSKNKEFFGPHKDAQYCPNGDQRSLLTLLVYLNDGFDGGETCCYFPKDITQNTKGMTTQEEMDALGGLKEGFDCVKIVPKVGYAVLFSQNILHESLPILKGTKYIVKTDVVVKRHSKKFGFAVENEEKDDYLTCLNYFREAQQQELKDNFLEASNLYERALSIRYCYPRSLQTAASDPEINKDGKQSECPTLPLDVWHHIFNFLPGYDAQNLVHAYPHLHVAKETWERHEKNVSGQKYLPKVNYQKGIITRFEFPDADFFLENADGCCRVAAMYSFFLLGHKPEDDVYTVRYNPDTQDVCAVALESFLTDVFYKRRCYGSFYNVRQQDPKMKDPKKDFEACVDRNYMLLRHDAEFLGVELPDSFYAKSTAYLVSDNESDIEKEEEEKEEEEMEEGEEEVEEEGEEEEGEEKEGEEKEEVEEEEGEEEVEKEEEGEEKEEVEEEEGEKEEEVEKEEEGEEKEEVEEEEGVEEEVEDMEGDNVDEEIEDGSAEMKDGEEEIEEKEQHQEEEEDQEEGNEAATINQVNVVSEEKITPQKPKEICDGSVPFYDETLSVESLVRMFIQMQSRICLIPEDFEDMQAEVIEDIYSDEEETVPPGGVVFFNAVKAIVAKCMKNTPSVSCALVSKLKEPLDIGLDDVCICFLGPNYEMLKYMGDSCTTEFYNHLVFDFHQAQLSVKCGDNKPTYGRTTNELLHPRHFEMISKEQEAIGCTGEPIFYQVNIEPIVSPATSFNHAACQCGNPRFEVHEYYNLKDYPYLTDIHLVARELDGKMLLWSVYGGIVAL